MNDTRIGKKEKYQHIQIFVRVRPISDTEKNNKSRNIIEIPNDKEVIVHEHQHDKFSKKFKFDNVFGPSSKQIDLYNVVVSPLLEQVLAGYNCTVFAYGQTGTGKTFTMEGSNSNPTLHWQSDSSAGMIPRSLSHLFDKLQLLEEQEYTIRVSFLELYNEDLIDLLSPSGDGSKIRLYDDASKKGAIIIHGLEEVTIHNKSEGYKILEKGSERRQTAATLMNTQSSRSHTVFSITVHMKESTIVGDEVLKTGKLNLVDLAGSENVGRSGAVDRRAREAGSINQSLLTLGRVITALVEKAPHIPYRESKLTRLLQESLGGRTKTSIIATISPASINMEETLSTLDYAHRARNITNRPERNQKLSKKEFLKQYTEEIERLRSNLLATREKNGVYLADDNYKEMQTLISQQTKEIEEKINHIKALTKAMQDKEKIFNELELQNIAQMKELHEAKMKLNNAASALESTNYRLKLTAQERDEQKYLVQKYMNTEQSLLNQAQTLLNVADTATEDSYKLHDKINRKSEREQTFEDLGEKFKQNVCECLQEIENDVLMYGEKLKQFCTTMKNNFDTDISIKHDSIDAAVYRISNDLPNQHLCDTNELTKNINESYSNYQNWIQDEVRDGISTVESEHELMSVISLKLAQDIDNIIENEIDKYLQTLRNNVSQKLKQTSALIKEISDSAYNYHLESYNHINKNLKYIVKNVETLREKQEFTQKQHLFTKMMESIFSQFNDLNKNQEEHYSVVTSKCNHVNQICDKINDQATNNSAINVRANNNLQEQIRKEIGEIESNLIFKAKQNEEVVSKITEQGKDLINELKSDINNSSDVLKQYKNTIIHNIEQVQPKMDADKNKVYSLINDAHKAVLDTSKNHAGFIKNEKVKVSDASQEISIKLENQIMKSSLWGNNIVEQLQTTVNEINKFFDQDIQRDISTGLTPARKEFSYPRQFKTTSPHERILQKFRETRRFVEMTEVNDDTYMNDETTIQQIANSTALSDVTFHTSPSLDNTVLTTNDGFSSKHTSSSNSIDSHIEK